MFGAVIMVPGRYFMYPALEHLGVLVIVIRSIDRTPKDCGA